MIVQSTGKVTMGSDDTPMHLNICQNRMTVLLDVFNSWQARGRTLKCDIDY
jgi:hypothetical protein